MSLYRFHVTDFIIPELMEMKANASVYKDFHLPSNKSQNNPSSMDRSSKQKERDTPDSTWALSSLLAMELDVRTQPAQYRPNENLAVSLWGQSPAMFVYIGVRPVTFQQREIPRRQKESRDTPDSNWTSSSTSAQQSQQDRMCW